MSVINKHSRITNRIRPAVSGVDIARPEIAFDMK